MPASLKMWIGSPVAARNRSQAVSIWRLASPFPASALVSDLRRCLSVEAPPVSAGLDKSSKATSEQVKVRRDAHSSVTQAPSWSPYTAVLQQDRVMSRGMGTQVSTVCSSAHLLR